MAKSSAGIRERSVPVTPAAADVLRRGAVTDDGKGPLYKLPDEQLDRKVYVETAKVLGALGVAWNRGRGGFPCPTDFMVAIAQALGDGKAVDQDKSMGFWPTPPALADEVVRLLELRPLQSILEPSAGDGALLAALQRAHPWIVEEDVVACELDDGRVEGLWRDFPWADVVQGDFLSGCLGDCATKAPRCIMNPPFGNRIEEAHVLHALGLLARGGRLVAIMPGLHPREDFLAEVMATGGSVRVVPVEAGAFKPAGTAVTVHILVVDAL